MNNLKRLRKKANLTLSELSKNTNIGQSTLCGIELGNNDFSIKSLTKLADFFNVSCDYLLGRQQEELVAQGVPLEDAKKLVLDFDNLNEVHKKCLCLVMLLQDKNDIKDVATFTSFILSKRNPNINIGAEVKRKYERYKGGKKDE